MTTSTTVEKAMRIYGSGRLRWQWKGRCYTAAGIHVPPEVIEEDDALIESDDPIPEDADVLEDLGVTLPIEALPEGSSLAAPPAPKKK